MAVVDPDLKKATYKEFNHHAKTFVRELMSTYPDIPELKFVHTMYKLAKTLSYKRPQRVFHSTVAEPFTEDIMKGNLEPLFKGNFAEYLGQDIVNTLIQHFITDVDDHNKEMIRQHLLVLLALNKKCLVFEKKNTNT